MNIKVINGKNWVQGEMIACWSDNLLFSERQMTETMLNNLMAMISKGSYIKY
jgi:hypothetical protein